MESNVFCCNPFCLALIQNELLKTAQSEPSQAAQWGWTGQDGCATTSVNSRECDAYLKRHAQLAAHKETAT